MTSDAFVNSEIITQKFADIDRDVDNFMRLTNQLENEDSAGFANAHDMFTIEQQGEGERLKNAPFMPMVTHSMYDDTGLGLVPKAMLRGWEKLTLPPKEGYNPFLDPRIKNRPDLAPHMWDVQSPEQFTVRMDYLDTLSEERAEIAKSRDSGLATFLGMMASPENLAPVVSPYSKVRSLKGFRDNLLYNAKIFGTIEAGQVAVGDKGAEQAFAQAALATGVTATFGTMLQPSARAFSRRMLNPFEADVLKESTPNDILTGGRYWGETPAPEGGRPDQFGASTVGAAQTNFESTIAADVIADIEFANRALAPTGTGIEKWGWSPNIRFTNYVSPTARQVGEELTDNAGMYTLGNFKGQETLKNVETTMAVRYRPMLHDNILSRQKTYLEYRQRNAEDAQPIQEAPLKNALHIASLTGREFLAEKISGVRNRWLSYAEFQEEVSIAILNGGEHHIREVAEQAAKDIELYNALGQEAAQKGLFTQQQRMMIRRLEKKRDNIQKKIDEEGQQRQLLEQMQRIERQIADVQARAERIERFGPRQGKALGYIPRIWRLDRIRADEDVASGGAQIFRGKLTESFVGMGMTQRQARKAADDTIHTLINNDTPYIRINDEDIADDFLKEGNPFRERMLDIDDREFLDFLELDSEALMRYYHRSTTADLTLADFFDGDITMKGVIDKVKAEYDQMIAQSRSANRKGDLQKEKEMAIKDIRAVRDRIRGTYGIPQDPYSGISRTVRGLKIWNVLTMLGGAAVSSMPDPARVLMTEGFANTFEYGFRGLTQELTPRLKAMQKRELQLAAVNLEATLGMRALQFMDAGDMFGRRFMFERHLHNAQGAFFVVNGLHMWNNMMKEFAGGVISARILESSIKQLDGRLDDAGRARLRASGISPDMADRIAELTQEFGEKVELRDGGEMWLPNTERWGEVNADAVEAFRSALLQDVNRTITTPGSGDRALWTSTEFGSLIAQFKSFGQASVQRTLISGLQEKDAAFFMGGAALIGMGMVVNEIKRAQFGISGEESLKGKIAEGVDRSGILGWFMDANNALEVLSDNKLGFRPLINEAPPYSPTQRRVMGTIFGPAGAQVQNAIDLGSDVLTGDVDAHTGKKLQRALPLQNHPFVTLVD